MENKYTVNGEGFNGFREAVNAAKSINAEVYEIATGLRRWAPAVKSTKRTVRHEIKQADGTFVPMTKKSIKAAWTTQTARQRIGGTFGS